MTMGLVEISNYINFLKVFFNRMLDYPYISPYVEVYISTSDNIRWAVNRLKPDPLKVKDFFGSTYEDQKYLYVTDLPFSIYDTVSLVYGIDKTTVKNMVVDKYNLDEGLLVHRFSQATDFYFKQKKVFKYILGNSYNARHIVDLDTGISFIEFKFISLDMDYDEKLKHIFTSVDLLKKAYKYVFNVDDSYLRWDSFHHDEIYWKSAILFMVDALNFMLSFLAEFYSENLIRFREVTILNEYLPWERELKIQVELSDFLIGHFIIRRGRYNSDLHLSIKLDILKGSYDHVKSKLKVFDEGNFIINNNTLIINNLSYNSFYSLQCILKKLIKSFLQIH